MFQSRAILAAFCIVLLSFSPFPHFPTQSFTTLCILFTFPWSFFLSSGLADTLTTAFPFSHEASNFFLFIFILCCFLLQKLNYKFLLPLYIYGKMVKFFLRFISPLNQKQYFFFLFLYLFLLYPLGGEILR